MNPLSHILVVLSALVAASAACAADSGAKHLFSVEDKNGDGFISKEESVAVYLEHVPLADEGFRTVNLAEYKRKLSPKEYESVSASPENFKKKLIEDHVATFNKLDLDHDGKISFDEYLTSYSPPPA